MGSGFTTDIQLDAQSDWDEIRHQGSGHFQFFKVRRFGALHFVKRPSERYRHDLVTVEALKKEFHIGYNLSHPSVVKYLRMDDGAVYEEYVDGLSLREMIDRGDGRLRSPDFLEHLCRQLMDAISYIHGCGVIHNDIKPENVMIARIGNQLKLVDFGCAYTDMWDATQGYTPGHEAPEQVSGQTNVYTDIFLVGKLMEELAPIAGVSRRWHKFISNATAGNLHDRFASDSDAIASIPRRAGRGLLGVGIISLILLAVGSLCLFIAGDRDENVGDEALATECETIAGNVTDGGGKSVPVDEGAASRQNEFTVDTNQLKQVTSGNNTDTIAYSNRVYNGETLDIPSSCRQLFASFCRCDNLTALSLGDNVGSIDGSLVSVDKLERLTIPNSCREVNGSFCHADSLRSVDFGSGIGYINGSFNNLKSIERLVIPSNCKAVAGSFTRLESLEELVIEDGVEKIDASFVYLPRLKKLTLPGSCKEVSGFNRLPNLEVLIIGEGVEQVMAFGDCENLKEIVLPSSLKRCDPGLKMKHAQLSAGRPVDNMDKK